MSPYDNIQNMLKDKQINKEIMLQIAIKIINDLTRPNNIIPTLLVFSVYSRLTKIDPLSLLVTKRAKAICVATKEVRRL
jgi:hypothetical protein